MNNNSKYDNELIEICNTTQKVSRGCKISSKKFLYLYDYVLENTHFLDLYKPTVITRTWFVLNKVDKPFTCLTCGKILKCQNVNFDTGSHLRFCCPHCECIHPDVKNVLKQTNKKRYGCEWTFQSDNNKSKSRKTMLEKYGTEYALQNKNIKEKSYKTMFERYGVAVFSQSADLLKKSIATHRLTMYEKFKLNQYVIPMFDKNEYALYGDIKMYTWKCKKCNTEFKAFRNEIWYKEGAVKSYARCEKCYPYRQNGSSYCENDIAEFIKLYDATTINHTSENRNIIPPLELDIYVPSKKLAIEYDGLYWHSDIFGTNKNYHLNKTNLCEAKGIQLIHIFENEWICKKDIVKSRLKNLLGIYDKTVFARKCEVKEVSSKESFDFQEANHIQGAANAKVNIGLYFQDELVSLMTFSKPRFDKKHEWELVRFCNKLGYHIPGAASKLLKHFEKTYNPKNIVSYADRRWSRGKLYEALGFKLDHISKPDYWYWKGMKVKSRISFLKHKLEKLLLNFDNTKSEVENMKENGYSRIFDCGNLVFEKIYV